MTKIKNVTKTLYGIVNLNNMKLMTTLTKPGHKFWEMKGHCINALNKYKKKYEKSINKDKMINPNALIIIEFDLIPNKYLNNDN